MYIHSEFPHPGLHKCAKIHKNVMYFSWLDERRCIFKHGVRSKVVVSPKHSIHVGIHSVCKFIREKNLFLVKKELAISAHYRRKNLYNCINYFSTNKLNHQIQAVMILYMYFLEILIKIMVVIFILFHVFKCSNQMFFLFLLCQHFKNIFLSVYQRFTQFFSGIENILGIKQKTKKQLLLEWHPDLLVQSKTFKTSFPIQTYKQACNLSKLHCK